MGKLNILHHKSYHVYNRENVERVKRDELRAELEAEAKDQSTIAANSEARLTLLRNQKQELKKKENWKGKERRIEKALEDQLKGKTKLKTEQEQEESQENNNNNKCTDNSSIIDPKNGHINFWSSLENQSTSKIFGEKSGLEKNPAYLNDLKKKNEKWDDLITMRLDKPAHELHPWYAQNDLINGEDKKNSERKIKEKAYKDENFKNANDPLTFIKSSLYPTGSERLSNPRKRKERQASRSPSPEETERRKRVIRKPDDEEELDDMPALPPPPPLKSNEKPSSSSHESKKSVVRILKIDESAEKLKAQALLKRHHASTPRSQVEDSPYGYSDLFNPSDVQAIRNQSRHHSNSFSAASAPRNRYLGSLSWDSSRPRNHHQNRDWESPIPSNRRRKF